MIGRSTRAVLAVLSAGGLVLAGCSSSEQSTTNFAPEPVVSGAPLASSVTESGVTLITSALGRLSDPANTFYELFTSAAPRTPFVLTTPSGTTTNGGIVFSGPEGISAIRQFDLLKSSAIVRLAAGRESGTAEMAPALGGGPSSVAINPRTGGVAILSTKGAVLEAPSPAGPFTAVAGQASLAKALQQCQATSATAVAYLANGNLAVGMNCQSGSTGVVVRSGGTFTALNGLTLRARVLRLDASPDGSLDALLSTASGLQAVRYDQGVTTVRSEASASDLMMNRMSSSGVTALFSTAYAHGTYAVVGEANGRRVRCAVGLDVDGHAGCTVLSNQAVVQVFFTSSGNLGTMWIERGGTVHFDADGAEQILKVAVPYGSAH